MNRFAALATTLNGQSKQVARARKGQADTLKRQNRKTQRVQELEGMVAARDNLIARLQKRIEILEKSLKLTPGQKLTLHDTGWIDAKTFAQNSKISLATLSRRFGELEPYGAYQEANGRLWIPAHCEALGNKPRGKRKTNSGSNGL